MLADPLTKPLDIILHSRLIRVQRAVLKLDILSVRRVWEIGDEQSNKAQRANRNHVHVYLETWKLKKTLTTVRK